MPQLDFFSFNNQFLWLIITFRRFYLSITYYILPNIVRFLKIRENLVNQILRNQAGYVEKAKKIKYTQVRLLKKWSIFLVNSRLNLEKLRKKTILPLENVYTLIKKEHNKPTLAYIKFISFVVMKRNCISNKIV